MDRHARQHILCALDRRMVRPPDRAAGMGWRRDEPYGAARGQHAQNGTQRQPDFADSKGAAQFGLQPVYGRGE